MAPHTALVLGATGGIGGEMARQLRDDGWRVRALHRRAAERPRDDGIAWLQGDALCAADVARAAAGAELLVHAVNPPGYRRWAQWVLPMIDHSIAAARTSGARIVLPGTVYNYGPDAGLHVDERAPQHPRTRKGAIRVELEARLRRAADRHGVRTLVVRAGDYFGPGSGNTWFGQGLVKAGRPLRVVHVPNAPGVGHQWGYLPDVAATMRALLAQPAQLDTFDSFHMGGHWDADGHAMADAIEAAAGRSLVRRRFPWGLTVLASPFVTVMRELQEMRYLWREPLRLDNRRLLARLGREPHTPLAAAVAATLAGMGCLPSASSAFSPTRA